MAYNIESGIKPPKEHRRQKYPFGLMNVGDSFPFPIEDYMRIASAMVMYGNRQGKKFRLSKMELRCWRVK
jgi:hypothetical protein